MGSVYYTPVFTGRVCKMHCMTILFLRTRPVNTGARYTLSVFLARQHANTGVILDTRVHGSWTRVVCTQLSTDWTRHRASRSMYSLTFRVRVTTPPQYGRNGTASLQITSRTQHARRFYRWRGESSPACVVRAVGLADYRWALPRISSVAMATQPVRRLQIRPIVHN